MQRLLASIVLAIAVTGCVPLEQPQPSAQRAPSDPASDMAALLLLQQLDNMYGTGARQRRSPSMTTCTPTGDGGFSCMGF